MTQQNEIPALESAMDALRKHGMRITTPRRRLAETLYSAAKPLSIEAIHAKLGQETFDLVTLYRCLDAFREAGAEPPTCI